MQMSLFYLVVFVLGIIHSGVTIFLGVYVKKNRAVKYIPSASALVVSIIFLVTAYFFSEGFDALGYFIFAMVAGVLFLFSFIPAMIIEHINSRKSL